MLKKKVQAKAYKSFKTYLEVYYPEASSVNEFTSNDQTIKLGEHLADQALSGFRHMLSSVNVPLKSKRHSK